MISKSFFLHQETRQSFSPSCSRQSAAWKHQKERPTSARIRQEFFFLANFCMNTGVFDMCVCRDAKRQHVVTNNKIYSMISVEKQSVHSCRAAISGMWRHILRLRAGSKSVWRHFRRRISCRCRPSSISLELGRVLLGFGSQGVDALCSEVILFSFGELWTTTITTTNTTTAAATLLTRQLLWSFQWLLVHACRKQEAVGLNCVCFVQDISQGQQVRDTETQQHQLNCFGTQQYESHHPFWACKASLFWGFLSTQKGIAQTLHRSTSNRHWSQLEITRNGMKWNSRFCRARRPWVARRFVFWVFAG